MLAVGADADSLRVPCVRHGIYRLLKSGDGRQFTASENSRLTFVKHDQQPKNEDLTSRIGQWIVLVELQFSFTHLCVPAAS